MPKHTYIKHPDGTDITSVHGYRRVTTQKTLEDLIVEEGADFWWNYRSWKPGVAEKHAKNMTRTLEALAAITGSGDPMAEQVRLKDRIVKRVRYWRSRADGGAIDSLGHNLGPFAEMLGVSIRPDTSKGQYDPFEEWAIDPRAYHEKAMAVREKKAAEK